MKKILLIFLVLIADIVFSKPAPQFITFKDGKFGVNFGGYHAEAGLGGLLTGDAAHGGLSASAGTPFGQKAGAGIGGSLNGRTAGGGYAGASAGYGVGASAAFGGGLDETGGTGGTGAEAHVPGSRKKVVKLAQTNGGAGNEVVVLKEGGNAVEGESFTETRTKNVVKEINREIQAPLEDDVPHQHTKTHIKKKISRPHKVRVITKTINTAPASETDFDYRRFFDFGFFSNTAAGFSHSQPSSSSGSASASAHTKTVFVEQPQVHTAKEVHHVKTRRDDIEGSFAVSTSTQNKNFWNDIFNIPISTLTAVNQLLNNKSASGGTTVEVHKTVGH